MRAPTRSPGGGVARPAGRRPRGVRSGTGSGTGPNTSAPAGSSAALQQLDDILAAAGHRGHPGHRRKAQLGPLGQLTDRMADRIPAHQRLHRPQGRPPRSPRPCRPPPGHGPARRRPASGAAPPPPPADPAAPAAPSRPAAARRRTRRPRPPARRPGVLTTSAGAPGTDVRTWSRPEVRTGTAGNARPSSSAVRRAPTIWARSRAPPHSGQCQSGSGASAPGAGQLARAPATPAGPAQARQRAGARHRSQASRGAYPRRGTWTSTGSALQPLPHHLPRHRRQPGGPRRGVPRLVAVADRTHHGRRGPHLLALGGQRARPARLDQLGRLDRAARARPAGIPARSLTAPLDQHLAGVRLRGVRIAVAGVPVVPQRDQPQIGDRREHRRPGPDHGAHRAPADRQPAPVALLGPGIGGQQHMPALPDQLAERRVHPRRGPPVRHHHQRATARRPAPRPPPAPAPAARSHPGSAVHTARGASPRASAARNPGPAAIPLPTPRLRRRVGRQGGGRRLGLRARPARRHRQLHHIGERPGIAVRDRPAQRQQLGRQHPLGDSTCAIGASTPR